MGPLFQDRRDAGRVLAQVMKGRNDGRLDMLVLALPRGGVPVGYEVAQAFGAELDVMLVRKLGVPGHEELAMGAIASGGAAQGDPDSDKLPHPGVVMVRNDEVIGRLGLSDEMIAQAAQREAQELARREQAYRGDRRPPTLQGREVVLVDDGLATGSTMIAAVRAVKQHRPARVVVAVPVAPAETCEEIRRLADDAVCATTPQNFMGVGQFYERFDQTSDAEVIELLHRSWSEHALPDREVDLAEVERFDDRHHASNTDGRRTHTSAQENRARGEQAIGPEKPQHSDADPAIMQRGAHPWP